MYPLPLTIQTADELAVEQLPPVTMVIGDIWPAGLYLLAGDPKCGKSLLIQDLALAIATGSRAWGAYPVTQGDCLYLAWEGGRRSFRDRILKMLNGEPAPARLSIAYESAPLLNGLEEQIELWLREQSAPRLVVIDTYAAVAPEGRGVARRQGDYKALAGMRDLAAAWPDTLFIVVHHTRKSVAGEREDPMQRISGSTGMTAVTDGNAVLSRAIGSPHCTLDLRPRNSEEVHLVLGRDERLRWRPAGTDERALLSQPRQEVLAWLDEHEGGTPAQIAESLGADPAAVRQVLGAMLADHQIARPKRGYYTRVTPLAAA